MAASSPSQADRWSIPLRLLHWVTVPLLAVQFAVSLLLMGDGRSAVSWLGFHISLGAVVFAAIGARLVCRMFDSGPLGRQIVVRVLQAMLYMVALGVSLTGWLAYRPSPFAVRKLLFGYLDLPVLSSLRVAPWALWHKWSVWLFLALVIGHVGLAIYHACIPGDRTMAAMSLRTPHRSRP
ncbi:MAG: cytochrome b/b6 domain-containing protein [Devosia sp.]|uniref:cytochrome b n=1 Tax=Devosia sp. TaxID=1871048 RepID=UPI001ACB75AA|nr:cytochrome b/b6 domain-containing protein [Devosia sp.]MBN9308422.1 cytochrome b/b6 domain-containing protein [Devosia sp.]MBN9317254.1 cytochrome b/b6 domain-containing protein [Devosia sp.]